MPVRGLFMRCPGHLEWVYMDHVAKGGKATEEIQWSVGKQLHKEGARPQWVPETQKKLRKWCLEEVMVCKKKDVKYLASPLVWETIYMAWGSHMSNFHRVTQYGSKIHHGSMMGVTCDTTHHGSCQIMFAVSKNNPHR